MRPALRSIEERRGVLMFTQVSHGDFLSGLFEEARSRFGIEFADQYPNLAVYTPQAKGLWGHEVVGGMAVRFFRWLDHDKPEIVVEGRLIRTMRLRRNFSTDSRGNFGRQSKSFVK